LILAHPWALALAPLAWIAALIAARLGRIPAMKYSAAPRWREARPGIRAQWARLAPTLAPAGAITLLSVALARPQMVQRLPEVDGRGIDIMLAVDSSLSMSATDFKPNRIEVAKDIAQRFVRGRVADRIGLVTFGGAPILICPLTTDYNALIDLLDSMSPGMTGVDATAIGDGLIAAARRLKDSAAKSKVIILLTDGRNNAGIVDPVTAAKTLTAYGIKVYAVGTAGRGPAMMVFNDPRNGPQSAMTDDDLDEELLSQLAALTGGKSYRAENRAQLADIFSEIDQLEKSDVKRAALVAVADRHWPATAAAALLLILESGLAATALLRWP
jgi:Ca-activated chloride channel family protein